MGNQDRRFADCNWNLVITDDGRIQSWDMVKIALLMDIRDELQKLNAVIGCGNFLRIPTVLDEIQRNTKKPQQKRTKKT